MAATIQSVKARQIFDSRGNPTVEVRAPPNSGPSSSSKVSRDQRDLELEPRFRVSSTVGFISGNVRYAQPLLAPLDGAICNCVAPIWPWVGGLCSDLFVYVLISPLWL
jgi:hypothetical protein